ncbi:hypothetical protein NCS52_00124800 [Fusarium sp. LHS14.1]|nr:hypothetical protein NCS52_00124800 [Fusarium sp. LHS14.1]
MSPPERGSRWSGRRRRRSHQGNKRHAHQQPAAGLRTGSSRGNRRRPRRKVGQRPHEQPPEPPVVCPAWVFIPFANVHVARDRAWFKDDYVPYRTQFTNSQGEEFTAIGIGTVAITIEWLNGERTEFILRNVLHSPDAAWNIVGHPIIEDYYIDPIELPYHIWKVTDKGSPIARFRRWGNNAILSLSEVPRGTIAGPNPLLTDKILAVYWPEIERDRFAGHVDCLFDSQRAWLKENWGDEFRFLRAHELNMYNEDERREGLVIMWATMNEESNRLRRRKERGYEDRIEQSAFANEPELLLDRFNSHLAKRHFSDAEREWIDDRYGDLKTFLNWFRYRLYELDELEEAKETLGKLMRIDEIFKEVPVCYGMR